MGVSLTKPASAHAHRPVSLEKYTPGRRALADAVDEQGAGWKFIAVRHVDGWSCLDKSAEILYGGDGMLLAGYFTRAEYAHLWGIIDGMMSRGAGHVAVVTRYPGSDELSVTRYVVREGRLYSAAGWVEEQYGPAEGETLTGAGLQAYEAARRDLADKDAAHIGRVADILSARRAREALREAQREAMKPRAAARPASAAQGSTA